MKVKHPLLTHKVDRLIAPAMSAALGIAAGFALLAMPADLMGWLLIAPPVDLATRLLVTLVGVLLFGGLAYGAFAWIDRPARPVAEDSDDWDFDTDVTPPVAMTRGNAKPKPILAGAELGTVAAPEPLEPTASEPVAAEEVVADAEDALLLEMPLTAEVEEALAAPQADAQPMESASLDELMRRLQAGIEGRKTAPAAGNQGALRDALHELQRMAAKAR